MLLSDTTILPMTREDVQGAFRLILGRDAKNEEEIAPYIGVTGDRILLDFLLSEEFISRKEMAGPLVYIANKVLAAQATQNAETNQDKS